MNPAALSGEGGLQPVSIIRAASSLTGSTTSATSAAMTARGIADEKFAGAVLPRIPVRRWGSRQDFAGVAVYLASDASSYHTGDSFVIDGAYTIF